MDYERIIEMAKHPKNFKKLEKSTHAAAAQNQRCGDDIAIELLVENGVIKEAAFGGIGCALAIASCSVLTEMIKNMKAEDAAKIGEEEMLKALGLDKKNNRKRCALLGIEALKKALG